MSFIFGGGGSSGGGSESGSSVVTQREAPGVEARKLSLYDQGYAKLAAQPVSLPAVQVAPISAIEQAANYTKWSNRCWCRNSRPRYNCITRCSSSS